MPRADLLALTADDLASVVNRGVVKRAERELAAGELSFRVEDAEGGELAVHWSDGVVCRFPAGGSLHDAVCSSGALGTTRHVVRSVFAYQRHYSAGAASAPFAAPPPSSPELIQPASAPPPSVNSLDGSASQEAVLGASLIETPKARDEGGLPPSDVVSPPPDSSSLPSPTGAEPVPSIAAPAATDDSAKQSSPPTARSGFATAVWNPGDFSDADLVARYRSAAVEKALKRFEAGTLVELVRGAKPTARFLDEPCTLRFLVPNDLRYLAADCAEAAVPTFAMLAVWAFRLLPESQVAGVVSIQQAELPTPTALLLETEERLGELAASGFAGAAPTWPQFWARLEESLREAGLVWPAELAADLLEQFNMYIARDARFDPAEAVDLVGELLARVRAIAGKTTAVPQLLVRGSRNDRAAEIAGGRLIGLGLGVRTGRRTTTLSAYLQDADSGAVAAVERSFADPPEENGVAPPPKKFSELAETVLFRGTSLGGLASSQLLLKNGKRTPSGRLVLPRTVASLTTNPQTFAWEQLKPPAAVESFAQLAARLETLPPSYLRPRRVTENLHVCSVAAVEESSFDAGSQRLSAVLRDADGGLAELVHPYHARGASGFEALASALEHRPGEVRFVCGRVTKSGKRLVVQPVCVVLDDGRRRTGLQPWIAPPPAVPSSFASLESAVQETVPPREAFLGRLRFELSELILSGLRRADPRSERSWAELAEQGRRAGFVRLVEPVARLAAEVALRKESLRWDFSTAVRAALDLCLICRTAADVM